MVWGAGELVSALTGPVAMVLFDDEGKANIESILTDLVETDFEQDSLRRILTDPAAVEDWRVGEAIAETYLQSHRACFFPWPDGRDERKSGSSLPGADLVGLGKDGDGDCIAFGEVKTSSQASYPPSVISGRKGLERQLEDLRDRKPLRDVLVKYLGHRATAAAWCSRYRAATRRYLKNSSDVQLYGVLIRDVPPDSRDLCIRLRNLAEDCPESTRIELLALYLPAGRINGIGRFMIERRTGGNA